MSFKVVTSTIADGSMYNRHNRDDPDVFVHLSDFVLKNNIQPEQTTRFNPLYDFEINDFCRYVDVSKDAKGLGMKTNNGLFADAVFTTNMHHALLLPIADCVAAVLYDLEHQAFGVSHLGRHSLEQDGGRKVIEHMVTTYGSKPENVKVWLSPAPSKKIYPIWALDNKGMKEVTFEQLLGAGILIENIIDNPIETDKDLNYYSYSEFLKGHRNEDGDYSVVAMMTD